MANTYYDSELTAEEIEEVLESIKGILTPANNGKVLAINNGKLEARSVQWGGGGAVVQPLSVTQNGIYNPPSGVDGYSPVTVNVSGGSGETPVSFTPTFESFCDSGSVGKIVCYGPFCSLTFYSHFSSSQSFSNEKKILTIPSEIAPVGEFSSGIQNYINGDGSLYSANPFGIGGSNLRLAGIIKTADKGLYLKNVYNSNNLSYVYGHIEWMRAESSYDIIPVDSTVTITEGKIGVYKNFASMRVRFSVNKSASGWYNLFDIPTSILPQEYSSNNWARPTIYRLSGAGNEPIKDAQIYTPGTVAAFVPSGISDLYVVMDWIVGG
jgi:hypothetical protein